jgi:hypothetical protein
MTAPVSDQVVLKGMLFPWLQRGITHGSPLILVMPGSEDLYLPCFSDGDKLIEAMRLADIHYDSVKYIQNETEFIQSVPRKFNGKNVHIIVDPVYTDKGTASWTEVLFD